MVITVFADEDASSPISTAFVVGALVGIFRTSYWSMKTHTITRIAGISCAWIVIIAGLGNRWETLTSGPVTSVLCAAIKFSGCTLLGVDTLALTAGINCAKVLVVTVLGHPLCTTYSSVPIEWILEASIASAGAMNALVLATICRTTSVSCCRVFVVTVDSTCPAASTIHRASTE